MNNVTDISASTALAYIPFRSALNVCHWHTAPSINDAAASPYSPQPHPISLLQYRPRRECFLHLITEKHKQHHRQDTRDHHGSIHSAVIRSVFSGGVIHQRNGKRPVFLPADQHQRIDKFIPAVDKGIDAHGRHRGLDHGHNDPEQDREDPGPVHHRGLLHFQGDAGEKATAHQRGHGNVKCRDGQDQGQRIVDQVHFPEHHKDRDNDDLGGEQNPQSHHFAHMHGQLPLHPRQRVGKHDRRCHGQQQGKAGYDDAVYKKFQNSPDR